MQDYKKYPRKFGKNLVGIVGCFSFDLSITQQNTTP
jgi:hypothetical protein